MAVSVIIKALNEEKYIAQAIESALAATAFCQSEIIVADSGSSDETVKIATGYPVKIVQLQEIEQARCGIGAQLGYQYAQYEFICLMDGDMRLDDEFITSGMDFLRKHPHMAGVTGHIVEMQTESLEYQRRIIRGGVEKNTGLIDRMNGGGLFRQSAIKELGFFTDLNLHAYEEYELGFRLRKKGWKLWRMDRLFARHYGHKTNAYSLALQRWRTGYLQGSGEVLRAHANLKDWKAIIKELPEIRLWGAVYIWWGMILLSGFSHISVFIVLLLTPLLIMAWRRGSVRLASYSVFAWNLHAIAFLQGLMSKRLDPKQHIASHILHGKDI